MRRSNWVQAGLLGLVVLATATCALPAALVSTMGNVNAVMSDGGYFLAPAPDFSGQRYPGDLAPTQAFEIIRPNGEKISLGRLNTSCICVQITSSQKSYDRGERAIIELRNVKATPPGGATYAIYVQLTSPVRTTLRFDTWVASGFDNQSAAPSPAKSSDPNRIELAPVPAQTAAKPPASAAAPAPASSTEPSSRYHPPLTVGGEGGIELIVPKWESPADKQAKADDKAEAKKDDTAASATAYSKELKIEKAPAEAKADAKKDEPPAPPITYSKELTIEKAPAEPPAAPAKGLKVTEVAPEKAIEEKADMAIESTEALDAEVRAAVKDAVRAEAEAAKAAAKKAAAAAAEAARAAASAAAEAAKAAAAEAEIAAEEARQKAAEVDKVIDKYMSTYKRDAEKKAE